MEEADIVSKMSEIFLKGGPIMWPLLVCSLLSLTITIERLFFWRKMKNEGPAERIERVFSSPPAGKGNNGEGCNSNRELMEIAALEEIDKMKSGLDVLDTIITMAPLLGILGTVLGIIDSFNMLAVGGVSDPRAATGGIARALITTALGLSVALIALIPFNYLVGRVKKATRELNRIIVDESL